MGTNIADESSMDDQLTAYIGLIEMIIEEANHFLDDKHYRRLMLYLRDGMLYDEGE